MSLHREAWLVVIAALLFGSMTLAWAFVLPSHNSHHDLTAARLSLSNRFRLNAGGLEGLIPPFGSSSKSVGSSSGSGGKYFEDDASEFESTSFGLIRQARRLFASDFGIADASLLSDDSEFIWIGPFVDEPLGKMDYLAAGRFFDLRAAFPDLDYRPHDFRIDNLDALTIRITCRMTGTMRGALRLRDGTFPPTGKRMICPPETVSITFNSFGKVAKLCTGFCMDRQVGNTKGSTGVMAAALVAGQAPSDFDLYPAPAVLNRVFGRPVEPIMETKSVLAPFPETVMIQLAKGILATSMAADDPSLLAENFEFNTPYVGPIKKDNFIEKYALAEFDNVDPSFSHFRVDPYDPVRVWVDVLPKGIDYQGCPQAMSFAFDDEGFCKRITSSYVLDPSIGNGGGLGGPEGYRYAMGMASPDFLTRPWSRVVGRARKLVLSPLTGVGVDDYLTSNQAKGKTRAATTASSTSFSPGFAAGSLVNGLKDPSTPVESLSALQASVGIPPAAATPPPAVATTPKSATAATADQEEAKLALQGEQEAQKLRAEVEAAEAKALEAKQRLAELEAQRSESTRKAKLNQEQQAARLAEQLAAREAAQASKRQRAEEQKALAEERRRQAEAIKALEAQKAKARAEEAAAKKAEAAERRLQQIQAQAEERRQRQEAQRAEAERKRAEAQAKQGATTSPAASTKKQQLAVKKQKEEQNAEAERKRAAARKRIETRKAEAEKKKAAIKATAASRKKLAETQKSVEAKQKQRQMEIQKAKQQAAALRKKAGGGASDATDDTAARLARQKAALDSLSNAVVRATVSLFGVVGFGDNVASSSSSSPSLSVSGSTPSSRKPVASPPKGVPVLNRWRKLPSGAVTGIITGSRNFDDGDRVTTSPIASGTIASGQLVQTGSGSRYFLV